MSSSFKSDIPLELPQIPMTNNKELFNELLPIYAAIQTLQRELSAAKERITALGG